jgi:propanediol dehydratase large subunit
MDRQRVNLDGFAHEDVGLGLVALRSAHDPEPSLVVRDGPGGRDGRPRQ